METRISDADPKAHWCALGEVDGDAITHMLAVNLNGREFFCARCVGINLEFRKWSVLRLARIYWGVFSRYWKGHRVVMVAESEESPAYKRVIRSLVDVTQVAAEEFADPGESLTELEQANQEFKRFIAVEGGRHRGKSRNIIRLRENFESDKT